MTQLEQVLTLFTDGNAEFVIIGGVAATLRGSSFLTYDIDLCYSRDPGNIARLASLLTPYHPSLRDTEPGLPFIWDERTLRGGLNFTLSTDLGPIDLLGEVPGLGAYPLVREHSEVIQLFGRRMLVLTLDALVTSKRATRRGKDILVANELEAIKALTRKPGEE